LVADGKGLLVMVESNVTCNKRFRAAGIPQTEEARPAYRELIVTAVGAVGAANPANWRQHSEYAMNLLARSPKFRLSWALTFSFARAIQHAALDIWHGRDANVQAAQQALLRRATCNRATLRGEYSTAME
jgi:fructose-bisphosphate aldolase class 1